ncbi:MAG: hypothetical protein K8H74_11240 [Notoacmeibacter sp.]|nr:hypothetical protein [Notoacmeibacter sp.]
MRKAEAFEYSLEERLELLDAIGDHDNPDGVVLSIEGYARQWLCEWPDAARWRDERSFERDKVPDLEALAKAAELAHEMHFDIVEDLESMKRMIEARQFISASTAIENLICVVIQFLGPVDPDRFFDRQVSKHSNNQIVRLAKAACDPLMVRIGRASLSADKVSRIAREMRKASDLLD